MTRKALSRRASARRDIEEAADYYRREGGATLALRYITAVETAVRSIREQPSLGSPRIGLLLNIEQLRSRPVRHFPYLILYLDRADGIEIIRILHARADLFHKLRQESGTPPP